MNVMAAEGARPQKDSSGDRMLAVLGLFTVEQPEWAVEAAAAALGISPTTAYRYVKRLTNAGLLSPVSRGTYVLGPAIVQMDRQLQLCDPMLRAARPVMVDLIQYAAEGSVLLLCRLFHDRVMCMHQVIGRGPQEPVTYERGRLIPLFRGATSKIILANLPARTLKLLFAQNAPAIAAAGLGQSWDDFRKRLAMLRREGVAVSRADLDPGRIGIAAPIFDGSAILGSLSFVLPEERTDDNLVGRLASLTEACAREIERAMAAMPDAVPTRPARVRAAR
jgi:DNA-binding IclR family transcriptional regulator